MYSIIPVAALLLSASAHPLRPNHAARHHMLAARTTEPAGWFHDYLEPYDTYHTRYLALNCQEKHDDAFFDLCCHPMLATETLDKNRAPECKPDAKAASSAAAAEPTSTVKTEFDDGEDCEEEDDAAPSPSPSPEPKKEEAPKSSKAPEPSPSPSPEPKKEETKKKEEPSPTAQEQPKETKAENNNNNNSGNDNDNSGGQTFGGGRVTFYDQGGVAGACGDVHGDYDLIGAMNMDQFNSLKPCGKKVKIDAKTGKSVTIVIADACPGCNKNSIDLSRGAFQALGSFDLGVIDMSWQFV